MKPITSLVLLASIALFVPACQSSRSDSASQPAAQAASADPGAAAWGGDKVAVQSASAQDTTPIKPGWASSTALDASLVTQGRKLFADKGCIACHNLGTGRKVGPDLSGVTHRDTPEWVQKMILDPDAQLASDAHAKDLLGTYMVKMTNQHATPQEARAIAEYFDAFDQGKEKPVGQKS